MTAAPLQGVRVLDLARGASGAIGRSLCELGADVVRVDAPGGGADRRQGPSAGGVGLAFAAANLGKRGVALDLPDPADRDRFETLAAAADILIENAPPGSPEARVLDVAALLQRHPALIVLSASDFGAGDYEAWQATDAVLHALSGGLSRSGLPGRAPLLPPGEIAIQCAAAQGVYAVLVAYLNRLVTGRGDRLELSLLEAAAQTLDPGYGMAGSATQAVAGVAALVPTRDRPAAGVLYPILPCQDGFVRLCVLAARQWRGLFEWMGRPAEFADPAFDISANRFASPTLLPRMAEFFAGKTRAEIEAEGPRRHVPVAALLTLEEALASDQVRERRAFAEVEIAPGVHAPFPNGVMEIDGERAKLKGPPPLAGQPGAPLISAWSEPRRARADLGFGEPGRPLAGLRVLDLGVIVVGSEQGRLLADYGAEVIKVENEAFLDGVRASSPGGMSANFAVGHRNKKSLGLNLRHPEGRALFLDLAAKSDVVLSNFKPGTLESLGLGADALLARNPRLILADSSGFGASGPWSERLGYGPLVRASAGLTARWRYPDEPGGFSDAVTIYPDHVAARVGVSGVLALLIRRARTGRGGTVSVSQTEVILSHMAAEIAALALRQRGVAVDGGPARDAPFGVFACAGDDDWCVVEVRGDADWQALCAVIERADLAADPALAGAAGRDAQRDRLDEAVAAWLAGRTPVEAMEALQGAGVPAGAMLRIAELPHFGYFRQRGLFEFLTQAQLEAPWPVDNAPVRAEHLARPPLGPAPLRGEHTRQLARDILGLGDEEIERMIAAGVLEAPAAATEIDPR